MSSTSPLGQRSSAPEATSFLVFALSAALLVYALTARSGEVRAADTPPSNAAALDTTLEAERNATPASEITTQELRVAPIERRRD